MDPFEAIATPPCKPSVAIIGSGPAALMAAEVIASGGFPVHIFEKRPGPARKLFIAGSSGLNISNTLAINDFAAHYRSQWTQEFWTQLLTEYSPRNWCEFIESLGLSTFAGTSGRLFTTNMNAALLIRHWRKRLSSLGATWHFNHECTAISTNRVTSEINLTFEHNHPAPSPTTPSQTTISTPAACFALGGGSYEPDESPLRWPTIFTSPPHNIAFAPFTPSNVGYHVNWPPAFLKEAEGKPIKNINLTSPLGTRRGELVVTEYGLEGTPIYFVGTTGLIHIDLRPELSAADIRRKCDKITENLAPLRRLKRALNLSGATYSLLFHFSNDSTRANIDNLIALLKNLPIELTHPRPLAESISAAGGIDLSELDHNITDKNLMLKKIPNVFLAGEMLNWDAPTGGFLIQACVSQGYRAGKQILKILNSTKPTATP